MNKSDFLKKVQQWKDDTGMEGIGDVLYVHFSIVDGIDAVPPEKYSNVLDVLDTLR